MGKPQEKAHKFDIGEGYGIWTDLHGKRKANERIKKALRRMGVEVK